MSLKMGMMVALAFSCAFLAGCANRPDWSNKRARTSPTDAAEKERILQLEQNPQDSSGNQVVLLAGKGPAFLAFPKVDDRVIARVGDEELRKSQVFDSMVQTQPEQVRATVAVLLGNRVLAAECEEHGITIDEREIDGWFATHRSLMLQQAAADYGKGTDFRTWVQLRFGQSMGQYEKVARNREKAKRLLSRLIRFHELREDRVQLRIISLTNRERAQAVHRIAKDGGDFATLAEQHSVHPSAESGGIMPPVWRASLNPALDEIAFELPVGVVSDIVHAKDQSQRDRFQIIKVIKRLPGKQITYADVADEIIGGLVSKPLAQDEWYMWQLKLERMATLSVEKF